MLDCITEKGVDVTPGKVFDLSEIQAAHEYLGNFRSRGKVVVMSE